MEGMPTATSFAPRIYDDFVPPHDLVRGKEEETFLISLPGFKREHIQVQINNFGVLRISGERPLLDNRWRRFVNELQVPEYCNASEISAKLEDGLLYLILPKFNAKSTTKNEAPKGPKTALDQRATTETKADGTSQETKSKPVVSENSLDKELIKKNKESSDANKDQIKEPKYNEKVTSDAEYEEGGNGSQMTETREEKAVTQEEGTPAGHGNYMLGNLKSVRRLRSGLYKRRHLILNGLAIVVLVGVGLYVTYRLKEPMQIGSYETELGSSSPS